MVNINRVILAGNLTRDPELKQTVAGSPMARFRLAVSRMRKGSDGELKKETSFFPIVVWNGTARNCARFLSKGRPVLVEGRLECRTYTGKDGEPRFITEVIGDLVSFLGPRKDPGAYTPPAPGEASDARPDQTGNDLEEKRPAEEFQTPF